MILRYCWGLDCDIEKYHIMEHDWKVGTERVIFPYMKYDIILAVSRVVRDRRNPG